MAASYLLASRKPSRKPLLPSPSRLRQSRSRRRQSRRTKKFKDEGKELRTLLLGQGLAQAGEVFGKMAAGLESASRELRDVNPELADAAEKGAKVAGALSSVTGAAAAGLLTMGPWGAAIGATTALASELGGVWIDTMADAAKATEAATKKTEEGAKQLAGLVAEMHKANEEAEKGSFKRWAEDMEEGADAMARQNDELERNLRLSREKLAAAAAIDRAETDRRIAEVTASDLTDAAKIDKIAGLKEGLAQRDSARKIVASDNEVAAEEERLKIARDEVKRTQEATRIADNKLREEQQKQAAIDQAKSQLDHIGGEGGELAQAAARVAKAQKDVDFGETIRHSVNESIKAVFGVKTAETSQAEKAAREKELADAQEFQARREKAFHDASQTAKGAASVDDAKKFLEEAEAKQRAAEEAALKQVNRVEDSKKLRDIDVETEGEVYGIQRQTRAAGTETQLRKEKERREEQALRKAQQDFAKNQREEERAAKEAEQERNRIAGIGKESEALADRAAGMAGKKNPRGAAALEKIGDALANDPTAAEMGQFSKLLDGLEKYLGPDSERAREVRKIKDQLRRIEAKLTKTGDATAH
jgi:hypothetical protein